MRICSSSIRCNLFNTYSSFEDKNFPTNNADGIITRITFIRFVVPWCRWCVTMPRPLRVWCSHSGGGSGGGICGGGGTSSSSCSCSCSGSRVMFVRFVRPLRSILRSLWTLRSIIRLLRVVIRASRPIVVWIVIRPGWSCSPWSVGRPNACRSCSRCCRSFRRRWPTW